MTSAPDRHGFAGFLAFIGTRYHGASLPPQSPFHPFRRSACLLPRRRGLRPAEKCVRCPSPVLIGSDNVAVGIDTAGLSYLRSWVVKLLQNPARCSEKSTFTFVRNHPESPSDSALNIYGTVIDLQATAWKIVRRNYASRVANKTRRVSSTC